MIFLDAGGHIDIYESNYDFPLKAEAISFFKVLKLVIKEKNAFIGCGDKLTEDFAMLLNWLFSPFYSKDLRRRLKEVNKMTYNSRHLDDYVAVIHNGVIDFVLRKKLKEIKEEEYICNIATARKHYREEKKLKPNFPNEQMENYYNCVTFAELRHDNQEEHQ